MTRDRFLQLLRNIKTARRHGTRAPHKPLLLLLALGRVAKRNERLVRYADVANDMVKLLQEFGPPRQADHPEFPFGRLRNDNLWEIPGDSVLKVTASGDLSSREMKELDVHGGFPKEVHRLLEADTDLVLHAAQGLLAMHFPPSLHDDIRRAVGLPRDWSTLWPDLGAWNERTVVRESRDSTFRDKVLKAYQHRCAICDHDIRLGDRVFGLEAAHIQWHSHKGPDQVSNGLALCVLHHKALDRGALGLDRSTRNTHVLVSDHVSGDSPSANLLIDLHGKPLRGPVTPDKAPSQVFVKWHRRQVFRAPAMRDGG